MKTRGGINGLDELISAAQPKQPLSQLAGRLVHGALQQNRSIISILRTKGGSGESHVVNAVLNALNNNNKSALVVHENPDIKIEKYIGSSWNHLKQDASVSASSCTRWGDFFKDRYKHFLKSSFDSIILTLGTASGTNMTTIKEMKNISDVVLLSVNSDVYDSVEPAVRYSQHMLESFSEEIGKIFIFCWYKELSDDDGRNIHRYRIYDPLDFTSIVDLESRTNLVPYSGCDYDDISHFLTKKLRIFNC